MMKVIKFPERTTWIKLIERPVSDNLSIRESVAAIIDDVKRNGDSALRRYNQKFDGVRLKDLMVTQEELNEAGETLPLDLKQAIELAARNIWKFHQANVSLKGSVVETMKGVDCWYRSVAIDKVGLYIPGGTAPLFSTLLMLAIPATIAGCKEIIVCTPAGKSGEINPTILFTASLLGVKSVYKVGGAQAVAAMAFGTTSVPQVHKIFGPGNQYVTTAKQLLQAEGVAIDMPAGPSELCIIADETAEPSFVAADLLSQAEHGKDSQVMFITTSNELLQNVMPELQRQLEALPRKEITVAALSNSKCIVVDDLTTAVELSNEYAPEHLIIACRNADEVAKNINNAGSVFLGNYSPESAGDYASGTNHTLPTNGYAKSYSGVSVDSFCKKISYQRLTKAGIQALSSTIIRMAEAEGLQAHANAVKIRIDK